MPDECRGDGPITSDLLIAAFRAGLSQPRRLQIAYIPQTLAPSNVHLDNAKQTRHVPPRTRIFRSQAMRRLIAAAVLVAATLLAAMPANAYHGHGGFGHHG